MSRYTKVTNGYKCRICGKVVNGTLGIMGHNKAHKIERKEQTTIGTFWEDGE